MAKSYLEKKIHTYKNIKIIRLKYEIKFTTYHKKYKYIIIIWAISHHEMYIFVCIKQAHELMQQIGWMIMYRLTNNICYKTFGHNSFVQWKLQDAQF